MKTLQEFLFEADSYNKYPHFSSKEKLLNYHGGNLPPGTYPKQRGSKENPRWGLGFTKTREKIKEKREKDIEMTTGQLTPREKHKVETKKRIARERGKEVHHGTEIETSGAKMRDMSPGERLKFKARQKKQHKFHGNDPRNLIIADKGPVSEFKPEKPGFHHGAYHSFERRHRGKLKDIESAITPLRAFTTLVNRERRRTRRQRDLQGRMAAAAKRNKIEED